METTNTLSISPDETKRYLEDFAKIFLRILVVTIAADMKKHSIIHFEDYLTILFFEYCFEKKVGQARKHTASDFN